MKRIILFLFITSLCGACAVKKDKQVFESEVRRAEWDRTDSLRWGRQLQVTGQRVMNVQRYQLSKPDSCGRQYVECFVREDIKDCMDTKEVAEAQAKSVQYRQEQTERYTEKRAKSQTASTGWYYRVMGIIGCLMVLYYLRKRSQK